MIINAHSTYLSLQDALISIGHNGTKNITKYVSWQSWVQTFSKLWDNISWIFYTSRSGDNQWTAWRRNKKNIAAQFMFIVRCIEAETIGAFSQGLRIRTPGIRWFFWAKYTFPSRSTFPETVLICIFLSTLMSYRLFFLQTFAIKFWSDPVPFFWEAWSGPVFLDAWVGYGSV